MNFPWWKEAVIYQIYPRSFRDANGDGIGDLEGIIEKLDYLNGKPDSLGVDAIWLSPIYPSPMHDFGYDISDYEDIDPIYGNIKTFKRLIKEAHRRKIRIIMDLVTNHTSHEHPWFQASRSSRDHAKRDWYIWHSPDRHGAPPNNWLGALGGPGWTLDAHTGQYYYHSFLKEQPDLNWRNPEVKEAIFKMIRNWLKMGVDGFRLDVVNLYIKDDRLRNNPVRWWKPTRPYDRQQHIYDRNRPEMHPLLKDLRSHLDSFRGDRMSVGEIMLEAGQDCRTPAEYYGEGDELHMAFNFQFFFTKWTASAFRKAIRDWENALLPRNGWPNYTLSNHDFPRHVSRYSAGDETEARARVAACMLLTLRGTPFLYYGEEIGMREERVPREQLKDPVGVRYWPLHPGRDGCRRPMCWSGATDGGFGSTNAWLPLSKNIREINLESSRRDPEHLWHVYRALIQLRRDRIVLRRGDLVLSQGLPSGLLAYRREYDGETLWIVLNFLNKEVPFDPLPAFRDGPVLFSISGKVDRAKDRIGAYDAWIVQSVR